DAAASAFATTFYRSLLRGERFMDAVAFARQAARDEGGNTWAAYQCYGDPDWVFRRATGDAARAPVPPQREFAGIASMRALVLALEMIATEARYASRTPDEQRPRIQYLEDKFGALWGSRGAVAEAFGDAWAAVAHASEANASAADASAANAATANAAAAFAWYRRAMQASDGTATLAVVEKAAHVQGQKVEGAEGTAASRDATKVALERWVGRPPM
ncbi:MAG TPA: hypothetical protein VNU21_10545, partial [Usitatibacter sp.]|nr:hypothetical protein [Usitatibacter sp.]